MVYATSYEPIVSYYIGKYKKFDHIGNEGVKEVKWYAEIFYKSKSKENYHGPLFNTRKEALQDLKKQMK